MRNPSAFEKGRRGLLELAFKLIPMTACLESRSPRSEFQPEESLLGGSQVIGENQVAS